MKCLVLLLLTSVFLFGSCQYIDWDEIKKRKEQEKEEKDDRNDEDKKDDSENDDDDDSDLEDIELLGFDINGKGQIEVFNVYPAQKKVEEMLEISGPKYYALGELAFERSNAYLAISDPNNTIIYDVYGQKKVDEISQIFMLERDDYNGNFFGIKISNKRLTVYQYNISSESVSIITSIDNVTGVMSGSSGFAVELGLYFFNTTNGLEIVDVYNKKRIKTVSGIQEAEYDPENNRLIGLSTSQAKRGTMVAYDLENEKLTELGILQGFKPYVPGSTSFDYVNQLYIMKTADGISFFDIDELDVYWEITTTDLDFVELAYQL
jgi:copper chaperone CopZ